MFKKSFQIISIVLVSVIAFILSMMLWFWWRDFENMKIIFFDVGQGDAILISQGSNQVLIDGGRSGKILLERLGTTMPFWDHQIETVVVTHPDEDHIGGLVDVVKKYRVGVFLDTKMRSDSATYDALHEEIERNNIDEREAFSGVNITFPDGGKLEMLYPFETFEKNITKETNISSVVVKLATASGKTFLFTGDLPSEQESLLQTGSADVLKAGHHGSKNSSSDAFLDIVKPKDIILSVGLQNRYGHPAPEAISRFVQRHARIFRTDTQGTIVYQCTSQKESECVVTTGKN